MTTPEPVAKSRTARRLITLFAWSARGAALLFAAFLAYHGSMLWAEWSELRREWAIADDRTVIGYVDIHPIPSFAAKPRDWVRDEGDALMLWSGWSPEENRHSWFTVARQDLDLTRLRGPMGRDVVRAIDRTLLEVRGGKHWEILPPRAPVVGLSMGGRSIAYPFRLLEKVEVVNDELGGRPVLINLLPFVPLEAAVAVYDPIVDGTRITLGVSGYFQESRPLLYDRRTESLWVTDPRGLSAVAGPLKGRRMDALARVAPVAWKSWLADHPESQLVVGADRRSGVPVD